MEAAAAPLPKRNSSDEPTANDGQNGNPDAMGETQQDERHLAASRALLSNAAAIPPDLNEELRFPPGVHIFHTQFKDSSLPHFQARLPEGESFQSKNPGRKEGFVF